MWTHPLGGIRKQTSILVDSCAVLQVRRKTSETRHTKMMGPKAHHKSPDWLMHPTGKQKAPPPQRQLELPTNRRYLGIAAQAFKAKAWLWILAAALGQLLAGPGLGPRLSLQTPRCTPDTHVPSSRRYTLLGQNGLDAQVRTAYPALLLHS